MVVWMESGSLSEDAKTVTLMTGLFVSPPSNEDAGDAIIALVMDQVLEQMTGKLMVQERTPM